MRTLSFAPLVSGLERFHLLILIITLVIIAPPPTGPKFPFEGSDKLLATANQSVNEVTLQCHERTIARENDRFKWLGNGEQLTLPNTRGSITVKRNERGSGFYCCEIYNSSSTMDDVVVVFDTYCVTLVFRGEPFFDSRVSLYLTLTPSTTYVCGPHTTS